MKPTFHFLRLSVVLGLLWVAGPPEASAGLLDSISQTALRDIQAKAASDKAKVATQNSAAKTAINQAANVNAVKAAAETKIDLATQEAKTAIDERSAVESEKARLEVKEKIFSAGVTGLFISNLLTIYGLFSNRKKSKLEVRNLEAEIRSRELEIKEREITLKEREAALEKARKQKSGGGELEDY